MMNALAWIILSTFGVSLIALIGIFTLALNEKLLNRILHLLIALSAGALIGGAFIHLIPEAAQQTDSDIIFLYVIIGFALFFIIEKALHWRHCHDGNCKVHAFAYLNLLGDSVHNFIDGMIIAASYVAAIPLGITTTLAVLLHEIPQEIGDFGVLVYGGFKKSKALLFNFITALTAVIGGIFGYYLSSYTSSAMIFLLPFAAGGFIYVSASDLIPELHKETRIDRGLLNFAIFLLGILIMFALKGTV